MNFHLPNRRTLRLKQAATEEIPHKLKLYKLQGKRDHSAGQPLDRQMIILSIRKYERLDLLNTHQ